MKTLSEFRVAQIRRLLTEYARSIEFELAEITEAADVTLADIADATDALNEADGSVPEYPPVGLITDHE